MKRLAPCPEFGFLSLLTKKRAFVLSLTASTLLSALPAIAGPELALQSETATIDQSQPAAPAADPPSRLLQGGVHKKDMLETPGDLSGSATATPTVPSLERESAKSASQQAFDVAISKLKNHLRLSAEDYRNLGVGCVGYETFATVDHPDPKVELVYRDSPAEQAGVRVGDVFIYDASVKSPPKFAATETWTISLFKAGTTNDVIVLRDGRQIPMKFVRMNVEDIKETKLRKYWEKTIRDLGDVPDGVYQIPPS